ncbi:spore coat protein [Candidatus Kuenenbacteria bacterium CG11_big_fil_rev_8_21_14_0_20_37_9]|uniref:Spore coat protein n=2 Tax=Candidatus Kueneniibacteriota TaxID=1752740 RepID=A0A2M6XS80_9BACT|nr:MAG: hypothetical protein AUJ29_01650 [Candidatus Kuenenbacteria bacterium CG1_02_38_13]PIR05698.1 MAG: spore coat protein [Candidatus Kuenenbacteria bacterium CG11_big_fil_rev_8_21_14_0_20_37_9]PIU10502.1 MAG: spore coat protein [Candidatus Kuenenbacteria bacterium CG08_land_8_20_14_0_20_37_23]
MILGVKIKELVIRPDKHIAKEEVVLRPGFLVEILRNDDGLLKKFGQTTFTVAYKGTIKAFHWHKRQDDLWFVASGKALIVLYDLRENSKTRGKTQIIESGEGDYKLILIPRGVAHGYKVISADPLMLFYHTTEPYNRENQDEERIPYNYKLIDFDWDKY